jgi:arsenite methyltransferase
MGRLEFDDDVARRLEVMYGTGDYLRRRALVRTTLSAKAGERILDLGCGPGLYLAEILEDVGPNGSVVGVDPSHGMLAVAARNVEGKGRAELREADAVAIPVADDEFDGAISVQVLEYVEDVDRALVQLYRALRPGGRLVVWDVDWDTVSWFSSDRDRMRRVLMAWDEHLVHPSLPQTLGARMRLAGFVDVTFMGYVFATDQPSRAAYGGASLISTVASFVVGRQGLSTDEVNAWKADLRGLGDRGEYFFSCVQFGFKCTKPGGASS